MSEDEGKDREDINASAVGLTNHILEHKEEFGVDMSEEIIEYFKEKLKAVGLR